MKTESALDPRIRALKDDTSKVLDDISSLSHTIAKFGATKAEDLSEDAVAALQKQLAAIRNRVSDIADESSKAFAQLDKNVRANPYVFILCALGLGFLLGKVRRP